MVDSQLRRGSNMLPLGTRDSKESGKIRTMGKLAAATGGGEICCSPSAARHGLSESHSRGNEEGGAGNPERPSIASAAVVASLTAATTSFSVMIFRSTP